MPMEVIVEREATHGPFQETAYIAQALKSVVHNASGHRLLIPAQRESLDQICSKVARILAGNPNEPDHWRDIGGYAFLGERA